MNRDNFESLPQWMKDLWSLAPNIARQVEAHTNRLESQLTALRRLLAMYIFINSALLLTVVYLIVGGM